MKRWLVRNCVLLVLGAIVNVAVAWGCTVWSDLTDRTELDNADAAAIVTGRGFQVLEQDPCYVTLQTGPGLSSWQCVLDAFERQGPSLLSISFESGWPCRSMRSEWRGTGTTLVEVLRVKPQRGIPLNDFDILNEPITRLLPLSPIWPGFAINTVFYALVLWLLFAAPFALRKRRRIKRGLCPKCAYDLRGSVDAAACPECGAAMLLLLACYVVL